MENQDIFSAWEIGINWEVLERIIGGIGEIARQVQMPVYLSRLRSIEELRSEAGRYYHAINQGFIAADEDQMRWLLGRDELRDAIDGFVFRLTLDASPWATIGTAAELAGSMGVNASVHLRMCGANPAEEATDDSSAANRIAEAMMASAAWDNVSVYSDTFADIDRGYFVRNGVLDRLYNPRLGFHVLRHLNAALNTCTEKLTAGPRGGASDLGFLTLNSSRTVYALVAPSNASSGLISVPLPEELSSAAVRLSRVNLENGVIMAEPTTVTSGQVSVSFEGTQRAPVLLIFESVKRDC